MEAHSYHFTPLDSLNDISTYIGDHIDVVADVDPDAPIRIVRSELESGKAQGLDKVHNEILKKAVGTGFYSFGTSLYLIIKARLYSSCLEGSGPLHAHQA